MSRDEALLRAAEQVSTPCYVYFLDAIRDRVAAVRRAFDGRFGVSYAVKANPNRALLAALRGVVDQLDVSSAGEVARAVGAGWTPAALSFTGPGKREGELIDAVDRGLGHVVLESVAEARDLDRIAGAAGRVQPVLLRITPARSPKGFGLTLAGRPCPFGVDEAEADDAVRAVRGLPHLDLQGFHVFSGTQGLAAAPVAENLGIVLRLYRSLAERHELRPSLLILGAGFGVPLHAGDVPLDLAEVAARVGPEVDALRGDPRLAGARLVLESGRYLVGEAGVYLTRVVRTKVSQGVPIAICDGGMHHHLAATGGFGSVIPRNPPLRKVGGVQEPVQRVEVVGPLCTTIDALGRKSQLPPLAPGDLVAVECSGAYGPTASPLRFISHPPPREVLVEQTAGGTVLTDVTEA